MKGVKPRFSEKQASDLSSQPQFNQNTGGAHCTMSRSKSSPEPLHPGERNKIQLIFELGQTIATQIVETRIIRAMMDNTDAFDPALKSRWAGVTKVMFLSTKCYICSILSEP